MLRYSKSSDFYSSLKDNFFSENETLLADVENKNTIYTKQPKRYNCKICRSPLPDTIDIVSHGVSYVFCDSCTHLNGTFEDTKEFNAHIYNNEYTKLYDNKFEERIAKIYNPKIKFLLQSLPSKKYKLLDIGCGCGYFVFSALLNKIEAKGIDIVQDGIDFGNAQIFQQFKEEPLTCVKEKKFYESIVHSNADIISAIGVIEHLRDPHAFFDAFKASKAQYCYYSVPMFSASVLFENIFKEVFPRQLSADHTHVFTETSIKKMNSLLGGGSIAEWRFGTDIVDLYRMFLFELHKNKCSQKTIDYFSKGFGNKIDEFQALLDKNHFCSEIHAIVSKS